MPSGNHNKTFRRLLGDKPKPIMRLPRDTSRETPSHVVKGGNGQRSVRGASRQGLLFPSPPARWNFLAERETNRHPSPLFGRRKSSVCVSPVALSPKTPTNLFISLIWSEKRQRWKRSGERFRVPCPLARGNGLARSKPRRGPPSCFGRLNQTKSEAVQLYFPETRHKKES